MSDTRYINREVLERGLRSGAKLSDLIDRGTGRTTAAVLSALASAIKNHGTPCVIYRHSGEPTTRGNADRIIDVTKDICAKLGLERIEVELKYSSSSPGFYVQVTSNFAEAL